MIGSATDALLESKDAMIVQSDVESVAAKPMLFARVDVGRFLQTYNLAFAFLLFAVAVIALQALSGSYGSEFSAYPDEPAHYVTSLMVWDYIRHFHLVSPLRFAQDYYEHYPKVALGHWPPFFYFIQAGWMLLFTPSRTAVRVEVALTTALLALSLFAFMKKRFEWKSALLAGLLCVFLPLVQTYSSEEMAEAMLTLCCFWSVVYFSRYIDNPERKNGVGFAVLFSFAVLTKGNGWLLALIPPISLFLTRKLALLKQRGIWLAAIVVGFCCLPWQIMTMKMAERGWEGGTHPSAQYSLEAFWEFLRLFPAIIGPVLAIVMLVGVYQSVAKPYLRNRVDARDACMFALLLAVWIFHSIIPAGVEDRKLIIAVPAMVYFLVPGVKTLANLLPTTYGFTRWRVPAITAILTVCFFGQTFAVPRIDHYGFDKVASFIAANPQLENSNILVSSQSVGEGLLVSELAMLHPDPVARVIRGTKALATVEWNGASYRCKYPSVGQLVSFLRSNSIGVIVVDTFPPRTNFLHDSLLRKIVENSANFKLIGSFRSNSHIPGDVKIYRVQL